MRRFCMLALVLIASPALAQPAVAIGSSVFVERITPDRGRSLEPAARLNPGDRVVYLVSWQRTGGSGGFTVTNPLPRAVYYQSSAEGDEQVSADGGKTWGKLGALRLGRRLATPEDVTHVRWRIASPRASGQIAYSGIVR